MGFVALTSVQYRLSRRYTGGDNLFDWGMYNNIVMFSKYNESVSARFIEGFGARDFKVEGYRSTYNFRKASASPQMLYEFHRFDCAGDERRVPYLRDTRSLTPSAWGLKVDQIKNRPMFGNMRYCDASYGEEIDGYNFTDSGINTGVNFYHKDFLRVPQCQNLCQNKDLINAVQVNPITGGVLYQTRSNQ